MNVLQRVTPSWPRSSGDHIEQEKRTAARKKKSTPRSLLGCKSVIGWAVSFCLVLTSFTFFTSRELVSSALDEEYIKSFAIHSKTVENKKEDAYLPIKEEEYEKDADQNQNLQISNHEPNTQKDGTITVICSSADMERHTDLKPMVHIASGHPLVDRVIVLWNDPANTQGRTLMEDLFKDSPNVDVVVADRYSLNNRYDPKLLNISTEAVMIVDDNMAITPDTINCAYESWSLDKENLHSFGKEHVVNAHGYSKLSSRSQREPNFLIPGILFKSDYLGVYFEEAHAPLRSFVDRHGGTDCDYLAFASVITKRLQAPMVSVAAPFAQRRHGRMEWFNSQGREALENAPEQECLVPTKMGVTDKKSPSECRRSMATLLNWTMPKVKRSTCSYIKAKNPPGRNKIDDTFWEDLSGDSKKAAKTLGYVKKTWDSREFSLKVKKTWYSLTEEKRQAARILARVLGLESDFVDTKDCMPDWRDQVQVFLLGAAKCGTTSLHSYIFQHPQMIKPKTKETFCLTGSWNPVDPACRHWYKADGLLDNPSALTGESTAEYLSMPDTVIPRIRENFPSAKFLVSLRDPVDRFHSHFQMMKRGKRTVKMSFDETVEIGMRQLFEAGLLPHFRNVTSSPTLIDWDNAFIDHDVFESFTGTPEEKEAWSRYVSDISTTHHRRRSDTQKIKAALSASIYSVPLRQWLDSFNRSDFLFLRFEELQDNRNELMHRIFNHFGLPSMEIPNDSAQNTAVYSSLHASMSTRVLDKLFAPYNKVLSRLLEDNSWQESWASMSQNHATFEDHQSQTKTQSFKSAYVWIVGGVNYDNPSKHQAYLYNILVSASILRDSGSVSDIIVYIQMSNKSSATTLTSEEVRWMKHFGIEIRYLEKSSVESFASINMAKTIVFNMTEYNRVLYLDTDVTVLGNLDYIFEMSIKGSIQSNLAVPAKLSPLNGGFFMVTPGSYERAQKHIVNKFQQFFGKSQRVSKDDGRHMDTTEGWGHVMAKNDRWIDWNGYSHTSKWDFFAADLDQGFFYYWLKYVVKDVTFLFRDYALHWSKANTTGELVLKNQSISELKGLSKPIHKWNEVCKMWMCDYYHAFGNRKIWSNPPPHDLNVLNPSQQFQNVSYFWFHRLSALNDEISMGIDFSNFSPVGHGYLGKGSLPFGDSSPFKLSQALSEDMPYSQVRFLLLGVSKCGTTSLYNYIAQHPQVVEPKKKETQCLSGEWNELDPHCGLYYPGDALNKNKSLVTGESTAEYLMLGSPIIERVKAGFPHAKFIVLLREPVERFYSHYQMSSRQKDVLIPLSKTLEVALRQLHIHGLLPHFRGLPSTTGAVTLDHWDAATLDLETFALFHGSKNESLAWGRFLSDVHTHSFRKRTELMKIKAMIASSIYDIPLRQWFGAFDRSKFLILQQQDLRENLTTVMQSVFTHLEFPDHRVQNPAEMNTGEYETRLDDQAIRVLRKLLGPYNEALSRTLTEEWSDGTTDSSKWQNLWVYD